MKIVDLYTQIIELDSVSKVKVDIKAMWGADNMAEECYIKVDELAQYYGKRSDDFFRYDINAHTVDYIQALIDEKSSTRSPRSTIIDEKVQTRILVSALIDEKADRLERAKTLSFSTKAYNYYVDDVRYNRKDLSWVAYRLDGRAKSMDKAVKGTYIHNELLIKFLGWLDAGLAVSIDLQVKQLIKDYHILKVNRVQTKLGFHKLVKASNEYFIPKLKTEIEQRYANPKLMDMINIKVLGMTAKAYKQDIVKVNQSEPTRDRIEKDNLRKIGEAEDIMANIIEYLDLNTLDEIRSVFNKKYDQKVK